MSNQFESYCLVLYPLAGALSEALDEGLREHLYTMGLLGAAFQLDSKKAYMLGESFYQLLSFMGCAPALKLEPESPGDRKFCHFRFVHSPVNNFRFLRPEVKARCPFCRKAGDTAEHIQNISAEQVWSCPHCQQQMSLSEINWKHEAGLARYFIELVEVHPHEVVPTDGLLKELESFTDKKWDYFYTVTQV